MLKIANKYATYSICKLPVKLSSGKKTLNRYDYNCKDLSHGMSYPISGLVKDFVSPGYDQIRPLVPHGLSVIVTAPAVFRFTAQACPDRHIEAASLLGADVANIKQEDAGKVLADTLLKYMDRLKIPNGIKALGYSASDIPALVEGTLPQERVTKLSPRKVEKEHLFALFENALEIY